MIISTQRPSFRTVPSTEQCTGDMAKPVAAATALVVITPVSQSTPTYLHVVRHDQSFIIHLIADAEQAPQTCIPRRTAPQQAAAAYRTTTARSEVTAAPRLATRLTA